MANRTVTRIKGFVLAVRDPEVSVRFYCDGLGFAATLAEGGDRIVHLGDVEVRLARTPERAMPPAPASANAPDFQHFAIRVRDMAAAFERLAAFTPASISSGGAQRLPPADGSVMAWKFRDPDGHPLELLQLAHGGAGGPLFEAIDHTAVSCSDLEASLAFYVGLGFAQGPSTHNQGSAQDRLDGLAHVNLSIATVHTAKAGPHIELLHYLQPPPPLRWPATPLPAFIGVRMASSGPPVRLHDPDGHALDLR